MSDWNHRVMFHRYLCDYMRKKNMHQTAEIFKEEGNVLLDPTVPHAIDVPEGFLHEWWVIFYEIYRSQQLRGQVPGEGPSTMVEQNVGSRQQNHTSPPQYVMDQPTISRVLTDADSWFNTGVNAMGSRRSHLIAAEQVPQVISSPSHQHSLLASKSVQYLPGHPANLPGQEVGCSVPTASRKEKDIASEEEVELILQPPGFENYVLNSLSVTEKHQQEHREKSVLAQSGVKSINTMDTIDGNCSGSCDMDTTSDASLKCKDDNVKSSSPHATRNKDNADSSSSKLPECATANDLNESGLIEEIFLAVHQVEESKKEGLVESKREV